MTPKFFLPEQRIPALTSSSSVPLCLYRGRRDGSHKFNEGG